MTVPARKLVPAHTLSTPLAFAAIALILTAASGCQSLPQLRSPSGAAWVVAPPIAESDEPSQLLSAVPDFDQRAETLVQTQPAAPATVGSASSVTAPPPATTPAAAKTPIATATPTEAATAASPHAATAAPGSTSPSASTVNPTSVPANKSLTVASAAAAATQPLSAADTTQSQSTGKAPLTPEPPANPSGSPATQATGNAVTPPNSPQTLPKFSERRPETFAWLRSGRSAGGRPFEIARSGTEGFRTLFVGSALGNDPAARQLIDKLAKHLHEHTLILGGFETAVIRTLNPDGAVSGQSVNALGRYINGRFPPKPTAAPTPPTPEVDFLLESVRSFKPQRVIHIRTIPEQSGIIAASENAAETAQAVAAALKFSRLSYPEHARAGSFEFCLSSDGKFEVITVAIPRTQASESDLWERYGDTLLNLIQPQSLSSREASRQQQSYSTGSR